HAPASPERRLLTIVLTASAGSSEGPASAVAAYGSARRSCWRSRPRARLASPPMPPVRAIVSTIVIGIVAGALSTLSPLTMVLLALASAPVLLGRRGLPHDEAAWVTGLLVAALTARALLVVGLNVASASSQNDQWTAMLFGDEGYALARAARTR